MFGRGMYLLGDEAGSHRGIRILAKFILDIHCKCKPPKMYNNYTKYNVYTIFYSAFVVRDTE